MDSKRKGKFFKWLLRIFAAGIACLVGILIGAYLARVEIANYFANLLIARNGFPDSQIQIAELDETTCVINDILLKSDSFELKIDAVEIHYDAAEVWETQRIKSVRVSGPNLFYDLTGPSTFDPQELDKLIKDGLPFPLDTLKIGDASIDLLTEFGKLSYEGSLELTGTEGSEIQANFQAHSLVDALEFDALIGEQTTFSAVASLPDLANAMAAYGIDLQKILPLSTGSSLELSSARLNAKGSFSGIAPQTAEVEISLGPSQFAQPNANVEIDSIHTTLELDAEAIQNINTTTHLSNATYDSFEASESIIKIVAPTLNDISIEFPETRWKSTSGEYGAISASATVKLTEDYAVSKFEVQGTSNELKADPFDFQPFQFSIDGNLDQATLTSTALVNQKLPWLRVENFHATLSGPTTDAPTVNLAADIIATRESSAEAPVAGNWHLTGEIQPNALPQRVKLSVSPNENQALFSTSAATVNGDGTLDLSIRHWPEENQAALELALDASNLTATAEDWSINGVAAQAKLAIKPIELPALLESLDQPKTLIELLARSTQYAFEFQGNEATGPQGTTFKWFSGKLQSHASTADEIPIHATVEIGIGISTLAPEEIQQFTLQTNLESDAQQLTFNTAASLLFEGEPVSIQSRQSISFADESPTSKGEFSIRGIQLISSDILARHSPSLAGTAFSAQLDIEGSPRLADGVWDASASLRLADGAFTQPTEEIAIDGIHAGIDFISVVNLITKPSQSLTADSLRLGDIEAADLNVQFALESAEKLSIEKAKLHTFDGTLALDPFSVSLKDPNTSLTLRFKQISIAPAIAMLDFFDGQVTGRLNGVLPISLVNGYPELGEGYLELDPNTDATFAYNADGFFTSQADADATKKTVGDKLLERLELEPNALLEDALGNLTIQDLRLDLFSKDLPGTPMRIQLAGIADTGNAEIPLNITTNINGTVAELLNFLMRLDSLGLVAAQQQNATQ